MGNLFGSARNPRCDVEVSNLFPELRSVMDEVCLIRSMKASHFDHSESDSRHAYWITDVRAAEYGFLGQLRSWF